MLERLGAHVAENRPMPLTHDVRVDRDAIHDLLDEMRATLPADLTDRR